MWCLFSHDLFLISLVFDALRKLCFVIAVFLMYLLLYLWRCIHCLQGSLRLESLDVINLAQLPLAQ